MSTPEPIDAYLITYFGDESIALIQWAAEHAEHFKKNFKKRFKKLSILSVDTGFSAPSWFERSQAVKQWATQDLGFEFHILKPEASFPELVEIQGKFPSRQFQWCANFLKALPLLDYLDTVDPTALGIILLAKRRTASRLQQDLPEYLYDHPKWGDRTVWHPLFLKTQADINFLLQKTPFKPLGHRSLECDPCIHSISQLEDLLRLDLSVLERTALLEKKLNQTFFPEPKFYQNNPTLQEALSQPNLDLFLKSEPNFFQNNHSPMELFDLGCGNTFGCGL